jgi:hypothetical protein
MRTLVRLFAILALLWTSGLRAETAFQQGCSAYESGDHPRAEAIFSALADGPRPAAGVLRNLGNAQWKNGRTGPAILSWERAAWISPFDSDARNNLRFARHVAQLNAPELAWHEAASTWLPVNVWPWLAMGALWFAASLLVLPGVFGWTRREWHQALVAAALAVFLLTLPAIAGVQGRTHLGVILSRDTPLRLTPTRDAQILMKLPAGEMARRVRTRGDYTLVRISGTTTGWIRNSELGLVCGN